MKNLEKIGIDTLVKEFTVNQREVIEQVTEAKRAFEHAQSEYKKIASSLLASSNDVGKLLVDDGVSDEAVQYFESMITDLIKLPFKLKR